MYPLKIQVLYLAALIMGINAIAAIATSWGVLIALQILMGIAVTIGNVYNIFAIRARSRRREAARIRRATTYANARAMEYEMLCTGELIPRDEEEIAIAEGAKPPAEWPLELTQSELEARIALHQDQPKKEYWVIDVTKGTRPLEPNHESPKGWIRKSGSRATHTVNEVPPPPEGVNPYRPAICPKCASQNVDGVTRIAESDTVSYVCRVCGKVW